MKRILITGGSGFIGKRLLHYLRDSNCNITLLSRKLSDNYTSIICDLLHDTINDNFFESIDTVFHLAGYAHSGDGKSLHRRINFESTQKIADAASRSKVKQFIFLSSVKAGFSPDDKMFVSENDLTHPEDEYGKSKRDAEDYLIDLSKKSAMNVKIIRSTLVYGKGMKGNLALLKKYANIRYLPHFPEFDNSKSIVHVDDVARALIFLANEDDVSNEIFYLTDGNSYSTSEIFEKLRYEKYEKKHNFQLPMILFKLLSLCGSNIKKKIKKLSSNELYSSEKIKKLGFETKFNLEDIDEKII